MKVTGVFHHSHGAFTTGCDSPDWLLEITSARFRHFSGVRVNRISACLITLNEGHNLARAVAFDHGNCREIVVVDAG